MTNFSDTRPSPNKTTLETPFGTVPTETPEASVLKAVDWYIRESYGSAPFQTEKSTIFDLEGKIFIGKQVSGTQPHTCSIITGYLRNKKSNLLGNGLFRGVFVPFYPNLHLSEVYIDTPLVHKPLGSFRTYCQSAQLEACFYRKSVEFF